MDGNLSREGMTADLEAMKAAGIGGTIIMEVDVGIPRGPVKFMSPQWQALFGHGLAQQLLDQIAWIAHALGRSIVAAEQRALPWARGSSVGK